MLRVMRRQARAWKDDFLRYWGRLRSFHRVALAILLAMAIIPAARRFVLDPLKAQVGEARAALQEKEAPEVVTLPEEDADVQELQLKIESLEASMDGHRAKTKQAVAAWPEFTAANKGAILAAFGERITQAGMRRLEFRDASAAPPAAQARPAAGARPGARASRTTAAAPTKTAKTTPEPAAGKVPDAAADKEPLASARYWYVLAGSFEAVRGFLAQIDRFAYPAKLEQVRLQLADGDDESGAAPPMPQVNAAPELRLSFVLKLYFHD